MVKSKYANKKVDFLKTNKVPLMIIILTNEVGADG